MSRASRAASLADSASKSAFEFRIDETAKPGDLVGALARLLLAKARRELGNEASPRAATPGLAHLNLPTATEEDGHECIR